MTRLALELGSHRIRAVLLAGRRAPVRTLELDWDPDQPAAAVLALADHFGTVGRVSAAVDLALLRVRVLPLPPLPIGDRRRILELEPDRHFADQGEELAFALQRHGDLVYAAPLSRVQAWLDDLHRLGPVTRLEPSPAALARALAAAGGAADLDLLRHHDGVGEVVRVRAGCVSGARRIHGSMGEALAALLAADAPAPTLYLDPWPGADGAALEGLGGNADLRPLPGLRGVDPRFLAALGAGLDPDAAWEEGLLTPALEGRLARRRRGRSTWAAVALAGSLLFALGSAADYRSRVERALDARMAELRPGAVPALALEEEARRLEAEIRAIEGVQAAQPDLIASLTALTAALPEGSWLRTLQAGPEGWRLEGSARDAAALVPLLENHAAFEDVRFLTAINRAPIGADSYENFALALRLADAS